MPSPNKPANAHHKGAARGSTYYASALIAVGVGIVLGTPLALAIIIMAWYVF